MNELIKFLKHEASLWCDENIPEQFSEEINGYGQAWENKFAELIVKECTNIILLYTDVDEGVAVAKKHFGVK